MPDELMAQCDLLPSGHWRFAALLNSLQRWCTGRQVVSNLPMDKSPGYVCLDAADVQLDSDRSSYTFDLPSSTRQLVIAPLLSTHTAYA